MRTFYAQSHIASGQLLSVLGSVAAVPLQGLALMEHPSLLTPVHRDRVREAVIELIAYTNRCTQAVERLRDVPPTPLMTVITVEWML